MRNRLFASIGIAGLIGALIATAVIASHNAPALEDRVATLEAFHGIDYSHSTETPSPPTPTPTEPVPTATAVPPTATEPAGFNDAWHAPLAHDGLNVHEHGAEPPQWVYDSPFPPSFPSGPELHQGFKGAYDVTATGVESYLLVHILASGADTDGNGFSDTGPRAVPQHSYKLWILDPSGGLSYWDGVLNFSPDGVNPAPLRTSDTGERPIILSNGDGGCETWYSAVGEAALDLGWTICGRDTSFDGTPLGGDGTFRTADWIVLADELPFTDPVQLSPTLAE